MRSQIKFSFASGSVPWSRCSVCSPPPGPRYSLRAHRYSRISEHCRGTRAWPRVTATSSRRCRLSRTSSVSGSSVQRDDQRICAQRPGGGRHNRRPSTITWRPCWVGCPPGHGTGWAGRIQIANRAAEQILASVSVTRQGRGCRNWQDQEPGVQLVCRAPAPHLGKAEGRGEAPSRDHNTQQWSRR